MLRGKRIAVSNWILFDDVFFRKILCSDRKRRNHSKINEEKSIPVRIGYHSSLTILAFTFTFTKKKKIQIQIQIALMCIQITCIELIYDEKADIELTNGWANAISNLNNTQITIIHSFEWSKRDKRKKKNQKKTVYNFNKHSFDLHWYFSCWFNSFEYEDKMNDTWWRWRWQW